MESDHQEALAAREQMWSSLRSLLPDVERLAAGQFDGTERERQVIQILARIISAELDLRGEAPPTP